MALHINIIGTTLILLAFIHIIFPFYFNWKRELAALSLINRQMFQIHTLFIALAVLLMGILCLTTPDELIYTPLGHKVCLGLGIFWSARLVIQLFGYSSTLWKNKRFETIVHIAFTILWSYMALVFFYIFIEHSLGK